MNKQNKYFNHILSYEKRFNSQVKFKFIAKKYARIMVVYLAFNDYVSPAFVSKIQC